MVFGLLDLIVSKSVCALVSLPHLYIIFYGYVCSLYGIVVNGCLCVSATFCMLYFTICFGFRVNEFFLAWFDCLNMFVLWTLIFGFCFTLLDYWLVCLFLMSRGLLLLVGFVFSRTICIVNISRSVWADKLLYIVSTTIGISGFVAGKICFVTSSWVFLKSCCSFVV